MSPHIKYRLLHRAIVPFTSRSEDSHIGVSEGKSEGKRKRNVTVFIELHENRSVGAYNTHICV
jgi:hypothetical protein